MKLILTNGYPYPYPDDASEAQKEAWSEAAQGITLEIAGVEHFEWKHTVTVEFFTAEAMCDAMRLTGWKFWDEDEFILEAGTSAGDGYDHPAIIAGDTAYCGFVLVPSDKLAAAVQEEVIPAFPQWGGPTGMTLRDYLIAHAPAEPQTWFEPVMREPRPRTDYESAPEHLRREVHAELMDNYDVIVGKEASDWIKDRRKAAYAWDKERDKRRFLQWPAAWADAQIALRAGSEGR